MNNLKTPIAQTVIMGSVFFFTFSAYLTIQAFASDMYGETLGSNMATSLYLSFTFACFLSPSVTNKLGAKLTMFLGVLGYACLVAASLAYFVDTSNNPDSTSLQWLVILGGVMCGIGAALLWTAQGRLIMQYSDGSDNGYLFSVFWALFNLSALVGGLTTFFYFGDSDSTGNTTLYVIFLAFVLLGAAATQLLVPPSQLVRPNSDPGSHLSLISGEPNTAHPVQDEQSDSDWLTEMKETLSLFGTRRMMFLSLIFFYTGYNQPYQLNTFGNRWFTEKTVGLEMIVFYMSEIVGGLYIGAMLDKSSGSKRLQRQAAKKCLLIFFLVTALSFALASLQEIPCAFSADDDCVTAIKYNDSKVLLPTAIYALWGFSDSQIQTYAYWLMGSLYENGATQARAVGFYKMIQSLGWTVGFALVPGDRMEPLVQLFCTAGVFVVGIGLAWFELPEEQAKVRRKSGDRGGRSVSGGR